MAEKIMMRISEIINETPSINLYKLVPVSGKIFDYMPGQFMILNVSDLAEKGKIHRRSYSIASTPENKEHLELCIKFYDNGTASPIIKEMATGTELLVEGPFGKFTLDTKISTDKKIFLVGSGSGIAPLMSMLRTIVKKKMNNETTLIYGFRNDDDFAYDKEILSYSSGSISIKPVASSSSKNWQYSKGYVQNVLNQLHPDDFKRSLWYLCGPPVMVKEVKALIEKKGVSPESIKAEMYE